MSDLGELDCCRLCFSQDDLTDELFPGGDHPNEELINIIQSCTSIRITIEKDYASPICTNCVRAVRQFHAFRQDWLINDRELRRTRGETDDFEEGDPLSNGMFQPEAGHETRDRFYDRMKSQIRSFLEKQTKKIEQTVLAKLDYELLNREVNQDCEQHDVEADALTKQDFKSEQYQETDFKQPSCSKESNIDWKKKYLTLQKNNELLQKAFQDQKDKIKVTEQMLKKGDLLKSSISSVQNDVGSTTALIGHLQQLQRGFTVHSAIPNISVEFLQNVNFKSGPGEKGDRNFVSKLAVAVFGEDTLANSSVTGRPSNAHNHLPPKPPLCPQKMAAIGVKLFERVQLEVGPVNQEAVLNRSHERVVRLTICQKSMNLRKQYSKRGLIDDHEPSPKFGRKKIRHH
ncbi:uncharacterized protein LOC128732498 [Sabethes cyaneus]|uniref:uncharacterized protein LOC128732498 n=1 Tax=Sabethes cyaneus TaxID=53552 RepID=UPI00237EAD2E|nr:uncharacterized protein LOC128732498 [Sabethes cyaneus]